ncbi:Lrp/AsnC family transcriptional regulator [Paracoccus aestuarii]|uniref:Lrp/AsnC family transcriptional regulator n=1 Tax=Paracoccus aestuarii TaxID=453842 RepID=A0A418ZY41_9RHOB|nr:Lrp/AsnC family transcriptional regulator [Paracoccus aestuarii]RJL05424.1 Lrp/AsnC family transcriptional regulator [Paracoccus aestuarii]WCQ99732.1 Lrp/AsnC family transcriptional regulator [Paracoccus aestuarii]
MDDMDQRLVAELRRDGRASVLQLAQRLGVSRATVRLRMDRLLRDREILGFAAITRGDLADAPVRGLMLIGIEGRGADRIMARLSGLSQVTAVHSTNGRWDLIVELSAQSLPELDRVLNRIRDMDGIMASETNLLLSTLRGGARPGV